MRRSALVAGALWLGSAGTARAQPWTDTTLSAGARARALVAAMTADEKIALVHGTGAGVYVGHVAGVPRLGIPDLDLEDGPAGVADGMTGVTAFPAPITVAASWDPDLAETFGSFIGAEQSGKGTNVVLGPMMNIDRVPAGGRNFEGFGEDPRLVATMAARVVRGIQSRGLVATAKHYVDNEQETNRTTVSSVVDDRTEHEIYLPPFAACVDAGVGAVMCSYNQVNGTFACENDLLENGWLKGELGFGGWIMSDWGATHSTVASAAGGLDMEMPGGTFFGPALGSAVAAGSIPADRLDDMAARILGSMFSAGLFDRPAAGSAAADVRTSAASDFARDAAAAGTVLLKNDGGLLPLGPDVRSIAVLGAAGDAAPVFQGGGSSKVVASGVRTARQGIAARAGSGVAVGYAPGAGPPFDDATALAASSDVAIVVVGATSEEGDDRATLSLPSPADALVAAVASANPRTVVVVYAPAQVMMPWADVVPAVLFGGLAGQEEGDAIAAVLFGDVNPSGKSPITFARSAGDYPAQSAAEFPGVGGSAAYSEGLLVGYRWFDAQGTTPLFPFGHGLSYTTFDYANLIVDPAVASPDSTVTVSFDVTNSGVIAGAEVAQLYLGLPAETSEPPNRLADFQKVVLGPGETRSVSFSLPPSAYSFWSAGRRAWLPFPGSHAVRVGASSRDVRLRGAFEVRGGPLAGSVHQAETAALSCSAAPSSVTSGYTGSGYVDGFSTVGASATFTLNAGAAGPCPITARYSATGSPKTLGVYVNGARVGQATFPPLANATTWDFETEVVDLAAGDNAVAYAADVGDTGDVRIDALIDCVSGDEDAGVPSPDAGGEAASGPSPANAGPSPIAVDAGCAPLAGPDAGVPEALRSEGFACGCVVGRRGRAGPTGLAGLAAIALLVRRRREGGRARAMS